MNQIKPVLKYKRKYLLYCICVFSLVFSLQFLLVTFFKLQKISFPEWFSLFPFFTETTRGNMLFTNMGLVVNIIVSILTIISLVFILAGKSGAIVLYIFSRVVLLLNILLTNNADKYSLSYITNFTVVLLYTLFFVLLYMFLTRKHEILVPVTKKK